MLHLFICLSVTLALCRSAVIIDGELVCSCNDVLCQDIGDCPLGEVKDICGCCTECARENGEPCGGLHNYAGFCGEGLTCLPDDFRQLPGMCIPEK